MSYSVYYLELPYVALTKGNAVFVLFRVRCDRYLTLSVTNLVKAHLMTATATVSVVLMGIACAELIARERHLTERCTRIIGIFKYAFFFRYAVFCCMDGKLSLTLQTEYGKDTERDGQNMLCICVHAECFTAQAVQYTLWDFFYAAAAVAAIALAAFHNFGVEYDGICNIQNCRGQGSVTAIAVTCSTAKTVAAFCT